MEDWLKQADNEEEEADKKSILFIGEVSSFIGNAIGNALKENGFKMIVTEADVSAIMKVKGDADIYLMYLKEDVSSLSDVLVFLKDTAVEDEKRVFLIGYEGEITEAERIIPGSVVAGTFNRPVNVHEMVNALKAAADDNEIEKRKKHILVVDDSGMFLRTVKTWLEPAYKVSVVNSGMNAITFLAKNKPDLILLDYEMPVCSGPQALSMIRDESTTSSLPVMFLTAKGDRESVMKVVGLKPDGYILKSLPKEEIVAAVDKFFEERKGDVLK